MTVTSLHATGPFNPDKQVEALGVLTLAQSMTPGRLLVAYSGGKDGLCAAIMAKQCGHDVGICEESYYFTPQRRDIRTTAKRLGVKVEYWTRLDYAFLAEWPQYVFPQTSELRNKFMQLRQRTTIEDYANLHGFTGIITGRKRQGNSVKAPIYSARGLLMVHPLASWSDEDVWAYLLKHEIEKPWIYKTRLGMKEGNTPWTLYREFPTVRENWETIRDIEPSIYIDAKGHGVVME